MSDFLLRPPVLVALCALAYAFATLAMKTLATSPGMTPVVLITATLACAVMAEVLLMRRFDIGMVYIGILVAETALVLFFAWAIGEALTAKQLFGAAFVLGGAALVMT